VALQGRIDGAEAHERSLLAEQRAHEKRVRELEAKRGDAELQLNALAMKRPSLEAQGPAAATQLADLAARSAALRGQVDTLGKEIPAARDAASAMAPSLEQARLQVSTLRSELETNRQAHDQRQKQKRDTLSGLQERRGAADEQLAMARAERARLLAELGQKLEVERLGDADLAAFYRALDELSGALTALELAVAELGREAAAVDRRALTMTGVMLATLVGLVSLLIVLL
jgi:chromosome segregation ATPase